MGITADGESAYAIIMTDQDEAAGGTFEHVTYRAKEQDPNVARLRGCILPVKTPLRVLRSHTLEEGEKWRPEVGLRYEGL